jgi:retron-type reverse transcriptase
MDGRDADKKAEMPEPAKESSGRKPRRPMAGASTSTAKRTTLPPRSTNLMLAVVERENLRKALLCVERNKGAAGVDKMPVEALRRHLIEHWLRIKGELLDGTYRPQPVRRVEIAKPGGGVRRLGVPTVKSYCTFLK